MDLKLEGADMNIRRAQAKDFDKVVSFYMYVIEKTPEVGK